MNASGWVGGVVLALVASSAQATVSLVQYLERAGEYPGTSYYSVDDPLAAGATAWSHRLELDSATWVQASGDLSAATLRASTALPEVYNGGLANAVIVLQDQFTLSGGAPGELAPLDYVLRGNFTPGRPQTPGYGSFGARLTVLLGYLDSSGWQYRQEQRNLIFTDGGSGSCDSFHLPGQTCLDTGTSVGLRGVLGLEAGSYTLTMELSVGSWFGWDADFGHTASAYLDLPDGMTLESSSGVLFKTAAPIPEPKTWALMLVGLMLVAPSVWRRARS